MAFVHPAAAHGVLVELKQKPEHTEVRPLRPPGSDGSAPLRILLTGGASCPDGIIQQVICRVNSFFPPDQLRSVDAVLADLRARR